MENNFIEREHKILNFWQENQILEKLKEKNKKGKPWSFLDGPITANNPMGVHHAWGRTYKDLFQRFKAMQGYRLRFQNGFDCQGLWVEVEVEKELGFKNKKDIERFGIENFVQKCKERVHKYSMIQTEQSIRLGMQCDWGEWKTDLTDKDWLKKSHSYYTMSDENNYAIWYFLKKCHQEGLLYKGWDVVPWCPRCGTAISQHEILTEEYKEITHQAVYVKMPLLDEPETYFLVWTTTPWTLPANVFLSVHPELLYAKVADSQSGEMYILLKDKAYLVPNHQILEIFPGKKLENKKYKGIFDELPAVQKTLKDYKHNVVLWKEVTAQEGTGIVHSAPGCGQEDFRLGKTLRLPVIDPLNEESCYKEGFDFLTSRFAADPQTKQLIFDNLTKKGLLYKIEDYTHRYPTCWRCKSELLFRLVQEWYLAMAPLRERLIKSAKKINWIPSFCLARELDWLKNMEDWLISKKRYWGLALPIWACECGHIEVIASKEELREKAAQGWQELEGHSPHRPWIDKVKIQCPKCQKLISRILDVGTPWLDAGIVPFSTISDDNRCENIPYFHNQRKEWQKWFPVQLVCESFPGQFKNWFYVLLVMSQVLEDTPPFKNLLGYALVVDEKGEEMHKSKGNAIWFDEAVEKIGADIMRWMYVTQNPAYNMRFGYNVAKETEKRILTLINCIKFFEAYANTKKFAISHLQFSNILDKWIASRLNSVIEEVTENLEKFDPMKASLALESFWINDLSLWYIRRSRKIFQTPENTPEKENAQKTFYYILITLVKLIAPFMPFLAEDVYQQLKTEKDPASIHLCQWPQARKEFIDKKLENEMQEIRRIVSLALAKRAQAAIGVRQVLQKLKIKSTKCKTEKDLLDLIKEEINVKEIVFDKNLKEEIELDTTITDTLKQEGQMRQLIRYIQSLRKKAALTAQEKDIIVLCYTPHKHLAQIFQKNKASLLKTTRCEDFICVEQNITPTNTSFPSLNNYGTVLTQQNFVLEGENVWLALIKPNTKQAKP